MTKNSIQCRTIGVVQKNSDTRVIQIHPDFKAALEGLDAFGHVMVLWWANKSTGTAERSKLITKIPYAAEPVTAGVFACRSEYRPNPIGVTVCAILSVDTERGTVTVDEIDAADGSPILDLKGYFPTFDRVERVTLPDWVPDEWPLWRCPVPEMNFDEMTESV